MMRGRSGYRSADGGTLEDSLGVLTLRALRRRVARCKDVDALTALHNAIWTIKAGGGVNAGIGHLDLEALDALAAHAIRRRDVLITAQTRAISARQQQLSARPHLSERLAHHNPKRGNTHAQSEATHQTQRARDAGPLRGRPRRRRTRRADDG